MELSKLVSDEEASVEVAFEELEVAQTELDEINEEYEQKMAKLDN
jgi:ATP-binding cassette subfamily F protein 3